MHFKAPMTPKDHVERDRAMLDAEPDFLDPIKGRRDEFEQLSATVLRELVDYRANTGDMFWKKRTSAWFSSEVRCRQWNSRHAGQRAGDSMPVRGYRRIVILGKLKLQHRVAWCIHHGFWPAGLIDHINGDKLDNRIENLRIVDAAGNARNMSMSAKNTSGITGVYQSKGRWRAQIPVEGRTVYLGGFATLEEAAAARNAAELVLGFHENHGRQKACPKNRNGVRDAWGQE